MVKSNEEIRTIEQVKELVDQMIGEGDYCWVINESLTEIGINPGDYVYVAKLHPIPENAEDLYTQRIKLVVLRLEDTHIKTEEGFYMIDPKNVERIDDEELVAKLTEQQRLDFAPEESTVVEQGSGDETIN